jgi:hypothetical protein
MLLSMHVHFLIITYIHISYILSELVSQCVSVRMTQFFNILIYSIHVKVYCYCPIFQLLLSDFEPLLSDFELLLSNFQLLLSEFEPLLSDFELLLFNFQLLLSDFE